MQPTTSHDDDEEPQGCVDKDVSTDLESDAESVESESVEIVSDIDDAFDANEDLGPQSETSDQSQVQCFSSFRGKMIHLTLHKKYKSLRRIYVYLSHFSSYATECQSVELIFYSIFLGLFFYG